MVYLELVSFDGSKAVYDYMPERKDADRGRVSYDTATKKRDIIKKSLDDSGFNYAGYAFKRIDEYIANGKFETSGVVSWY